MLQLLLNLDEHAFFLINGMHSILTDHFFMLITQLGNGWFIAPLLVALVWWKTPKKQFGKILLISIIGLSLCGIANSQLKKVFKRPRPLKHFSGQKAETVIADDNRNSNAAKQRIHVVGPNHRNKSFPSGHTNTAFSVATFLVILFGRTFLFAYIPAFFVGYSRIYLGVHFPLDVIAGAVLGSMMIWGYFLLVARFIGNTIPHSNGKISEQASSSGAIPSAGLRR